MAENETSQGEVSEGDAAIFAVQRLANRLRQATTSDPSRRLLDAVNELQITRRLLTEACGMLKVLDRHAKYAAIDEFFVRVEAARKMNQPPQVDAVDPHVTDPGTPTPRA